MSTKITHLVEVLQPDMQYRKLCFGQTKHSLGKFVASVAGSLPRRRVNTEVFADICT